jgi:predicted Holliday junction resolvase-like endonuclease
MSSLLSKLNLAAGITVFVLTILLIVFTTANRSLQAEAQAQENKIRTSQQTQQASGQVAGNIAKELAQYSVQNEKVRSMLERHGFNVQVRPASGTSAPAAK